MQYKSLLHVLRVCVWNWGGRGDVKAILWTACCCQKLLETNLYNKTFIQFINFDYFSTISETFTTLSLLPILFNYSYVQGNWEQILSHVRKIPVTAKLKLTRKSLQMKRISTLGWYVHFSFKSVVFIHNTKELIKKYKKNIQSKKEYEQRNITISSFVKSLNVKFWDFFC